jgi:hypothetical protein
MQRSYKVMQKQMQLIDTLFLSGDTVAVNIKQAVIVVDPRRI